MTLEGAARFDIAQEAERHAHGNPSGLDARTVLASGPIQFHEGRIRPLAIGADLSFVLADSVAPGSTATAVACVCPLPYTVPGNAMRTLNLHSDAATRDSQAA